MTTQLAVIPEDSPRQRCRAQRLMRRRIDYGRQVSTCVKCSRAMEHWLWETSLNLCHARILFHCLGSCHLELTAGITVLLREIQIVVPEPGCTCRAYDSVRNEWDGVVLDEGRRDSRLDWRDGETAAVGGS